MKGLLIASGVIIVIIIIAIVYLATATTTPPYTAPPNTTTTTTTTVPPVPPQYQPTNQPPATQPPPIVDPLTIPPVENEIFRCPQDGAIYKLIGGKKYHFTLAGYTAAGTPAYRDVSCSIVNGIPGVGVIDGATEGEVVICQTTGGVYQIAGGKKLHFTPAGYAHEGSPYATPVDCGWLDTVPDGSVIDYVPPAVTVDPATGTTTQTPTPVAVYQPPITISPIYTPLPAGLRNGDIVKCFGNDAIWALDGNMKRHFTPAGYAAAGSPMVTQQMDCFFINPIPNGPDVDPSQPPLSLSYYTHSAF